MAFDGSAQATPLPTEDFTINIFENGVQVHTCHAEVNVSTLTIAQVIESILYAQPNSPIPDHMLNNPGNCMLAKNEGGVKTMLGNSSSSSNLSGFQGTLEILDNGTPAANECIFSKCLHSK